MRWITELLAFKLYNFMGAVLLTSLAYTGVRDLGYPQSIRPYTFMLHGAILGGVICISIALALHVSRRQTADTELTPNPLEWSRGATAGSIVAFVACTCFALPALTHDYPLRLVTIAIAAIMGATSGIAIYFWSCWNSASVGKYRHVEALKAETGAWIAIFSGVIVWVGVFVASVIIAGGITPIVTNPQGLSHHLPVVGGTNRAILHHCIATVYAAVGTIIWLLRPLQRRVQQAARRIDILPERQQTENVRETGEVAHDEHVNQVGVAGTRVLSGVTQQDDTDTRVEALWHGTLQKGLWEGAGVLVRGLAFYLAISAALLGYVLTPRLAASTQRVLLLFGMATSILFFLSAIACLSGIMGVVNHLEETITQRGDTPQVVGIKRGFLRTRVVVYVGGLSMLLMTLMIIGGMWFLYRGAR